MKRLLDTDVCIGAMRGRDPALRRFAALSPDRCAISSVTLYELFTGVEKCRDPKTERAKIATMAAELNRLDFDERDAAAAARVRAALESAGTPIGAYDTLLAGVAIARGLTLATGNIREFSRVAGLAVEDWAKT